MKRVKRFLLIGLLLLPTLAFAQNFNRIQLLPSSPLRVNGASNYVLNSSWLELPKSGGIALSADMVCTNASTSNVVFTVQFSADKVKPVSRTVTHTVPLTGTTNLITYTNFTTLDITGHADNLIATDLSGLNWYRLRSINNADVSSLFLTNVYALIPR